MGRIAGIVCMRFSRATLCIIVLLSLFARAEDYFPPPDSEGGWRASLDLSRPLIKDKLALRFSTVKESKGFTREPAEAWFPDALAAESAGLIVLFDGEQRAGVDIVVKRAAARCVEATLRTAAGPGAHRCRAHRRACRRPADPRSHRADACGRDRRGLLCPRACAGVK